MNYLETLVVLVSHCRLLRLFETVNQSVLYIPLIMSEVYSCVDVPVLWNSILDLDRMISLLELVMGAEKNYYSIQQNLLVIVCTMVATLAAMKINIIYALFV